MTRKKMNDCAEAIELFAVRGGPPGHKTWKVFTEEKGFYQSGEIFQGTKAQVTVFLQGYDAGKRMPNLGQSKKTPVWVVLDADVVAPVWVVLDTDGVALVTLSKEKANEFVDLSEAPEAYKIQESSIWQVEDPDA